MGLLTYRIFVLGGVLLSPLLLALFWIFQIPIGVLFLSLLILGMAFFYSRSPASKVWVFILFMMALGGFFLFLSPRVNTPPSSKSIFRIHNIQESKSQVRLHLVDTKDGRHFLAIYYKPRTTKKLLKGFDRGNGLVLSSRETKKQIKILLKVASKVIELTFRKAKLTTAEKSHLLHAKGQNLSFNMAIGQFLKEKRPPKTKKKTKIDYTGFPISFTLTSDSLKAVLHFSDFSNFPSSSLRIGDFITPILKTPWKEIKPFHRPFYLFSQGFSFIGHLQWFEKLPLSPKPTITEKTVEHLLLFYKNSPYQSFYRSVLLARNPLDKNIYRLFQRNELVHLLVISGSHIDIMISFFLSVLSFLFALFYGIKKPRELKHYLKELRFFRLKAKSFPIFLSLSLFLVFYLMLTDAPQAGARAIFGFLLVGLFFHSGYKVSITIPFLFSIAFCFLVFPEWLSYPLGLLYSSLAVWSLYLTLPLIRAMLDKVHSRFLYGVAFSLLTSFFVSLFIAPLSFFFFHYYNFLSIFSNIIMGLFFTLFIYLASLASILSFLSLSLGLFFLHLSDFFIGVLLRFLEWIDPITFLKFYISDFSWWWLCFFYILLFIVIKDQKKRYDVLEMTT